MTVLCGGCILGLCRAGCQGRVGIPLREHKKLTLSPPLHISPSLGSTMSFAIWLTLVIGFAFVVSELRALRLAMIRIALDDDDAYTLPEDDNV